MNNSIYSELSHPLAARLRSYFGWLSFLFFATILVFDHVVYNLLALLLVLTAIVISCVYRLRWDTDIRILAWVLVVNLLLTIPNIALGRDGLISVENPVRMFWLGNVK